MEVIKTKIQVQRRVALILLALFLVAQFSFVIPVQKAIGTDLFIDDFETGDLTSWTTTTKPAACNLTVQTAYKNSGTYALKMNTTGITSGTVITRVQKTMTDSSTVYTRFYVMFPNLTLQDNDDRMAVLWYSPPTSAGAYDKGVLGVRNFAGEVRFYITSISASGTQIASVTDVLPVINTWYCLEFKMVISATAGESRLWIDGVEKASVSGVDNSRDSLFIQKVSLGSWLINIQHDNMSAYFDDLTSADAYVGPIGEEPPAGDTWAVISTTTAGDYFRWFLANQSILFVNIAPSDVVNLGSISNYLALFVSTTGGAEATYNVTAIEEFCKTKMVLLNMDDFVGKMHANLAAQVSSQNIISITYLVDLGWFDTANVVPFNGNNGAALKAGKTILWSGLTGAGWSNCTRIADFDATHAAIFRETDGGSTAYEGCWIADMGEMSYKSLVNPVWNIANLVDIVSTVTIGTWTTNYPANGVTHATLATQTAWWQAFAYAHPTWANWSKLEHLSQGGRDQNVSFIGSGSRYIWLESAIHGNEKIPTYASRAVAEYIVADAEAGGIWATRLTEVTVIILPILNVDGYNDNHREDEAGRDLNRQWEPGATTPTNCAEVWNIKNLIGNLSSVPIMFIDLHEGGSSEPNDYIYAAYMPSSPLDVKGFGITTLQNSRTEWQTRNHWGNFTDGGYNFPIDTIHAIEQGSITSMAEQWASQQGMMAVLPESIVWSPSLAAIQTLYGIDYYTNLVLRCISSQDRMRPENFLVYARGNIKSMTYDNEVLKLKIDSSALSSPATTSIVKVDVGNGTKPLSVLMDGVVLTEGAGWTWSATTGQAVITGIINALELSWTEAPPPETGLDIPYTTISLVAFSVAGGSVIAIAGYRRATKTKKKVID